jgi:hypothetical protein
MRMYLATTPYNKMRLNLDGRPILGALLRGHVAQICHQANFKEENG